MKRMRFVTLMGAALAAMLLAAAAGPLFAQNKVYTLRAGTANVNLPDGTAAGKNVPLWGYAVVSFNEGTGGADVIGDDVVAVPGPRLTVAPGQGLVVNLINELPEPVSITIPGQPLPLAAGATSPQVVKEVVNGKERVTSFVHVTPAGSPATPSAPVQYIWPSIAPGTYLYQSGTHPAVQVQMGLYGALTKNAVDANSTAGTPAEAYAAQPYNSEVVLLYSELDPVLHDAVAGGTYGAPGGPQSALDYNAKYFLVNGEVLDDTSALPSYTTTVGSATLLRLLNASLWDHVPQFLGTHVFAIAEDGKPYPYARQQYSLLLPAGKTLDAILTPAAVGQVNVLDRRFFRSQLPAVQGSMHARILVQ